MKLLFKLTIVLVLATIFTGCTLLKKAPVNSESVQLEQSPTTTQETAPSNTAPENQGLEHKYVTYSPELIAQYSAQGKKVILFFHAGWCPTCRAAEKDITARATEIPADIVILKVDYDTYGDLKKKYNVTYQHTFVQVDGEGNEITTWNGGDLDEINKNIKLSFCDPANKNSC